MKATKIEDMDEIINHCKNHCKLNELNEMSIIECAIKQNAKIRLFLTS